MNNQIEYLVIRDARIDVLASKVNELLRHPKEVWAVAGGIAYDSQLNCFLQAMVQLI